MDIGRTLLKREEVTSAARTIREHTIDSKVEVFVKNNGELLELLKKVKTMNGVRDVVWTEVVETIGRKSPPNHIPL